MAGTKLPPDPTCLSRTCLKWTPEGELAKEDLRRVLARLAAAEGHRPELWRPDLDD
jgi:hypothetical protein